MKIYLNKTFECSAIKTEEHSKEIETSFFDGKCKTYIEGMRFVPAGQKWTREDGAVFEGEMLAPWRDSQVLEAAQGAYEDALAALAAGQSAQDARIAYVGMMTGVI
ncbi:MAG: hypothetical protein RSA97_02960 [Oscillospiraceae bacterium]